VLRKDVDDVNQAVYDEGTDTVRFRRAPTPDEALEPRAVPVELAHNLIPLMQFVFSSRADGEPDAVWAEFERIYLSTMDDRGSQVIEILRECRNRLREASDLNTRALGLAYSGELDAAQAEFEEVLRIRQETGDLEGYCGTLLNLALTRADAGDLEGAHAAVDRAIKTAREHGRRRAWSLALFQKGLLLKRQGDRSGAVKYGDLALFTWNRSGLPVPEQFVALLDALRAT
jgi:tetratricopeptide (TPR) repeat protein